MEVRPDRRRERAVLLSDEVLGQIGLDDLDDALDHLDGAGGRCWDCQRPIRPDEAVSVLVHMTATSSRMGFAHAGCVPPQVLDRRRNRRAALRSNEYLQDRSTDVQAFVVYREYPAPKAMLVVSPEVAVRFRPDGGEVASPWLDWLCAAGFGPVAPDILDAQPDHISEWEVDIEGEVLRCGGSTTALFQGRLDLPQPWRVALKEDGECVVLAAARGVISSSGRARERLNDLAQRGLVVGATVSSRS